MIEAISGPGQMRREGGGKGKEQEVIQKLGTWGPTGEPLHLGHPTSWWNSPVTFKVLGDEAVLTKYR